jgi:branched-chain amino acid transport system substrate-binding protein
LELAATGAVRQAAGVARGAAMPFVGVGWLAALVCGGALALSGCLGDGGPDEPRRVKGDTATVYSSAPGHGASAAVASAVSAGERRALAEAGGRAGGLRIRLRQLPATDDQPDHPWNPAVVSENANRAADDPTTIAYLGELDYGATAVSLPITNHAGLLQVSPSDGLTSLTQRPPGRPRAGPERYYPLDQRTFVRLGPTDLEEAEYLVKRARASGAKRIAVVYGGDIYGRELAPQIFALARRAGLEPVASEEYRGQLTETPDIASRLADAHPDVVIHAAVADRTTAHLLSEIDARLPMVLLLATSGILAGGPSGLALPAAPARIEAIGPAMSPQGAGYQAMRLVLDAVDEGHRDRRRVIAAARRLAPRIADSLLALYQPGADGRFERVEVAR